MTFYTSQRLDVRRIETIKSGGERVGTRHRVRVKKNKVAPPFRSAELTCSSSTGSTQRGLPSPQRSKATSSYVAKGQLWFGRFKLGQQKSDAIRRLAREPLLADRLYTAVMAEQQPHAA